MMAMNVEGEARERNTESVVNGQRQGRLEREASNYRLLRGDMSGTLTAQKVGKDVIE